MTTSFDAAKLMLENSIKHRTHQDTLRWTLLGGYAVFLTAGAGLLGTLYKDKVEQLSLALPLLLFLAGTLFLLALTIENWFYVLVSGYAKECDERFAQGRPLATLEEYRLRVAATLTPFQYSFFFAQLIAVCGNGVFLYAAVLEFYKKPLVHTSTPLWLNFAVTFGLYLLSFHLCLANWGRFTYPLLLQPLARIYTRDRSATIAA